MNGTMTLLWQPDGTAVAYIDDPDEVLQHRLSCDRLRDLALSPPDSLRLIRAVLKEHRHHEAHP